MKKANLLIYLLLFSSCSSNSAISSASDTFTIMWKNYDGSILEIDSGVKYGEIPTYNSDTPTRPQDNEFLYSFFKFEPDIEPAIKDTIYVASYHKFYIDWTYDNQTHWHTCADNNSLKLEESEHVFKETIIKNPTCTSKGLAKYSCTCGFEENRELQESQHTIISFVSNNDATCTKDGTKYGICSVCFTKVTITDENSKLGHNWNLIDSKAVTCEEDGYEHYVCERCNEEKVETFEKYGSHNYVNGSCTRCGDFKYKNLVNITNDIPCELVYFARKTSSDFYNKIILEKVILSTSTYNASTNETSVKMEIKVKKVAIGSINNDTYNNRVCLCVKVKNIDSNEIIGSYHPYKYDADEIGTTYTLGPGAIFMPLILDGSNHYEITFENEYRY